MKKSVTEEQIFELLDGNLTDEEKSEILRELPNQPELESLYRSLLITEEYVKSHAIDKISPDFTDRVTGKVQRMISQKKRNGILYRALSIFGLITVASIAGVLIVGGNAANQAPISNTNIFNSLLEQLNSGLTLVSGDMVRNVFMVLLAFTFFVFMDRVLLRHFSWKN